VNAIALSLLVLVTAACGSALPVYDYRKEPDPRRTEFVIGVGDVVNISVWKNPDFGVEAPVRPDGAITMPVVGDIRAIGRTPTDIKAEVTAKLTAYITDKSAVVTVGVVTINSYRFSVSGQVNGAGVFSSTTYVTVMEAIAMAGGLTRFAKRKRVVIVRTGGGASRRIPIDYDAIADGKRPDMNLVLLAGDTVYVP
jgi:polysaccharide export outer membrane protein